jgi:hypothetical protein
MSSALEHGRQDGDDCGDGSDDRSCDQQVGVLGDHHGHQMLRPIADGAQ